MSAAVSSGPAPVLLAILVAAVALLAVLVHRARRRARTAERELREALHLARADAERRRLEALGTLAGGVAHDFNNILMAILGNAQLAMAKIPEGAPGREHLDPILESGQRAKALVSRILDFSRADAIRLERVDLAAVVREAVRALRSRLPADVRLEEDLPPGPLHADADGARVQRVVENLGENALHALREGGGALGVALRAVEPDATVRRRHPGLRAGPCAEIRVFDTGRGIPKEIRGRIFDPFLGTGRGLALVWGIVADHGGAVDADSIPGRGTEVRVLLPCEGGADQPGRVIAAG